MVIKIIQKIFDQENPPSGRIYFEYINLQIIYNKKIINMV